MIDIVEFDFGRKKEVKVQAKNVKADKQEGIYYWINLDEEGMSQLIPLLNRLCPSTQIEADYFQKTADELVDLQPDFISFTLLETALVDKILKVRSIRMVLGACFMVTLCEDSRVMRQVRESYQEDFVQYAKSPGFLLFEIVDSLAQIYQLTFRQFEEQIEELQTKLLRRVDDEVFFRVSNYTRQLLAFRLALVSAREIISVIASRKSLYVSATTQPFLERKVLLLTRLSDDLAMQRAVVSDALNLYIGFVGYQTNRVINRLTVISVIFLPLTFLVGIYGMNFTYMPELQWRMGYPLFWLAAVLIVVSLLLFFYRKKWLKF
jgi:magnesium transporter